MGNFSYLCSTCNESIKEGHPRGQLTYMYLLVNGKVIEELHGEYNGYGGVFDTNGKDVNWSQDHYEITGLVADDPVSLAQGDDGVAAYHQECKPTKTPTKPSFNDPEQGWGKFEHPEIPYKSHYHKVLK